MNKNAFSWDSRREIVSDDSLDSPESSPIPGTESFQVRRLSSRNLQLPPLAFRQAEQYDWDRKPESEPLLRPTSLAIRTPPLIAVTSADTSRSPDLNIIEAVWDYQNRQ